MGLVTYKTDITYLIPQAKVVQALVEAYKLPPKEVLQVVKWILDETTSSKGSRYKTVKHMVEIPDKDNFIYTHSIIEGDAQANAFEIISHKMKITALPEGRSVWKSTSEYFTDGEVELSEEKIMAMKAEASAMFRAVVAYVDVNPTY